MQAADSIRQVLARVRASVPRYLWAAQRGFYKCMVGNGATVKKALIAEGHLVTAPPKPGADKPNPITEVETQLKQVAETKYQAECTQVADAPIPTESEYQELKDKRAKTKQERWIERKGNLVRRYGSDVAITPELVAKDDEGWYAKILSHYYLTVGRPYLIERDSRQLKAYANTNKNRLWLPDFNRSLLSTSLRLLETLIIGLLQPPSVNRRAIALREDSMERRDPSESELR